jgi:hypothetical protein
MVTHVQTPAPIHTWLAGQDAAAPHCPHVSQVSTSLPEHLVSPGVQAGVDAHEHAPHWQLVEHVHMPYVLHTPVDPDEQAP